MADKKESTEEKEGESSEGSSKGKSKKKLLIIVAAVVVLLIAGGAVFFLMGSKEAPKEGEEVAETVEVAKPKRLATLKLDPFIVNLSENISFLKVTMILEYDPEVFVRAEKNGEVGGEAHGGGGAGGEKKEEGPATPGRMAERQPMVRDAIIHTLSSKKVVDVITTEGKDKLKEELVEAINDAIGLPENPVVNVYFLDFIIQ